MPKVSVIIPVYNSELHIRQCLESLISQTETNIEIIIIDDGSTDNSPRICDEYSSLDERITVVHGANHGVSHARNEGIELANGEFLLFLDADDYIKSDTIEKAYEGIKSNDADLIIWNYAFVDGCDIKTNRDFPTAKHIFSQKESEAIIATTLCPLIKGVPTPTNVFVGMGFVWNKLFKTDIVKDKGILFTENVKINEDVLFVCNYLRYVKEVVIVEECQSYYRVNENGATLSYKPDIEYNNRLFIECLKETVDRNVELIEKGYYCRIIRCLSNVAQYYCFHRDFRGKRLATLKNAILSNPEYIRAISNVDRNLITRKQRALLAAIKILRINKGEVDELDGTRRKSD